MIDMKQVFSEEAALKAKAELKEKGNKAFKEFLEGREMSLAMQLIVHQYGIRDPETLTKLMHTAFERGVLVGATTMPTVILDRLASVAAVVVLGGAAPPPADDTPAGADTDASPKTH